LGQKTLFLSQKTLFLGQKVWKKFGKVWKSLEKFGKFGYFGNRVFGTFENYKKMTLNSNFGNRQKLVPTQKPTQMFGLKFGMQGLSTYPLPYQNPSEGIDLIRSSRI